METNSSSMSILGAGSGHTGGDPSSLSWAAWPRRSSLQPPVQSFTLLTGCVTQGLSPPHGEVMLFQPREVYVSCCANPKLLRERLQAAAQQQSVLSGLKIATRALKALHALLWLTPSPDVLQPWLLEAAPSLPVLCVPVLGGSAQEGT